MYNCKVSQFWDPEVEAVILVATKMFIDTHPQTWFDPDMASAAHYLNGRDANKYIDNIETAIQVAFHRDKNNAEPIDLFRDFDHVPGTFAEYFQIREEQLTNTDIHRTVSNASDVLTMLVENFGSQTHKVAYEDIEDAANRISRLNDALILQQYTKGALDYIQRPEEHPYREVPNQLQLPF